MLNFEKEEQEVNSLRTLWHTGADPGKAFGQDLFMLAAPVGRGETIAAGTSHVWRPCSAARAISIWKNPMARRGIRAAPPYAGWRQIAASRKPHPRTRARRVDAVL
jgi:hypothetical protein